MDFLNQIRHSSVKTLFPSNNAQVKQPPTPPVQLPPPMTAPAARVAAASALPTNVFSFPACADYEDYMDTALFSCPEF